MLPILRNVASRSTLPLTRKLSDISKSAEFLQDVLNEQAASGPVKTDQKWRPFQAHRFVKPYELTYKSRFIAPPAYKTRRPAVGPPPAIARSNDVFHQLDIDPLSQAMNPDILRHFVSEMGKIYGRNITGLTTKSQRRLGKAIRRAKMMGIIPVLSRSRGQTSYYPPKQISFSTS